MNIFIWRHSKLYSSWSMFDEPHIYKDNYQKAEVIVMANSIEEAIELLQKDKKWDTEELKRIDPLILPVDRPTVLAKNIIY